MGSLRKRAQYIFDADIEIDYAHHFCAFVSISVDGQDEKFGGKRGWPESSS